MSTNPEEVDWDWVYKRNKRIWLGLDENDNPIDEKELDKKDDDGDGDGDKIASSFFKDLPFLPQNLGAPKNCITQWYGKRHKDLQFKEDDCFFTWNRDGNPHGMKGCIFKCPLTGELFGCGQFGDESKYEITEESIHAGVDGAEEGEKVKIVWHRKSIDFYHLYALK